MSWKSRRIAGFLSGLISITTMGSVSYAQTTWNYSRITSCTEGDAGSSLVLGTTNDKLIPAPKIQYLPGPDGQTMMVADFAGLSYILPPHIIRPAQDPDSKPGIEEIRVGQFQANPPICRIAVSSHNPAALKSLSFSTTSRGLVVKWSAPAHALNARKPAVAPTMAQSVVKQNAAPDHDVMPPNAPPRNVGSAEENEKTSQAKSTSSSNVDAEVKSRSSLSRPHENKKAANDVLADVLKKRRALLSEDDDLAETAPISKDAHIAALLAVTKRSAPARKPSSPKKSSAATAKMARSSGAGFQWPMSTDERNNKVLTSPSQGQSIKADKIKKSAPLPKELPVSGEQTTDAASPTEAQEATGLGGPMQQAAQTQTKNDSASKALAKKSEDQAPGAPMARLTIVTDTELSEPNAAVQLLGERGLKFKSFRLHAPERYVLDLDKPSDLDEATVASFQDNRLLKSVRIAVANDKTCRVVFDLADETVQVQEKIFPQAENVLTLTLRSQPVTAKSNPTLDGISIVLDAGHGGTDPGAQRGDVQEKDMTLGIINQLKKRLEAGGAHITMTRVDDTFVSLEDRVKLTNSVVPSAFVSVHINALESTNDIKGVETYYQTEQSKPLADAIHACLVTTLGVPDRGVRKARFYVINHTQVPAVLAEVGFISNKEEREKLTSSDYQARVADALARGVVQYLGKSPEALQNTGRTASPAPSAGNAHTGTSAKSTKSLATSLTGSAANAARALK